MVDEEIRRLMESIKSQQKLLEQNMKERKSKIRKFMLFINNSLNDSEKELKAVSKTVDILDAVLLGRLNEDLPRKVLNSKKRRVSFAKPAVCEESLNELVPETIPTEDSPPSQRYDTVVPETQYDDICEPENGLTEVIQPDTCDTDITIGVESMLSQTSPSNTPICHNADESISGFLDDLVDSVSSDSKVEFVDAPTRNPQSVSLHGCAKIDSKKNSDVDRSRLDQSHLIPKPVMQSGLENSATKNDFSGLSEKSISGLHVPETIEIEEHFRRQQRICDSPILVCDMRSDNDASHTATKPAVWPIRYPRSPPKAQRVIEPNNGEPYRPGRQTRLDSFLTRASHKPKKKIITLSGERQAQASWPANSGLVTSLKSDPKQTQSKDIQKATAPVVVSSNEPQLPLEILASDEESDGCDLDLEILRSVKEDVVGETRATEIETNSTTEQTFDQLPATTTRNTAGKIARSKKARKDLTGYRCKQCYEYFSSLHLTEEQIQERMQEICRHRAVKAPAETPPKYWDMSMMSTSGISQRNLTEISGCLAVKKKPK